MRPPRDDDDQEEVPTTTTKTPATLESLPTEILRKIASIVHDPRHSAASPSALHSLLSVSKTLFHVTAPIVWHSPRIGPLATCESWRAFLDAIAGGGRCFPKGVSDRYADMVFNLEDVWLFVGGEDEDQSDSEDDQVICAEQSGMTTTETKIEQDLKKEPENLEGDCSISPSVVNHAEPSSSESTPTEDRDHFIEHGRDLERKDSKIEGSADTAGIESESERSELNVSKLGAMSLAEKYSELIDPSTSAPVPPSFDVSIAEPTFDEEEDSKTLLSHLLSFKPNDIDDVHETSPQLTHGHTHTSHIVTKRTRDTFIKADSNHFLEMQSRNSLHYGLALMLTHCPNLRSIRLHLPAAPLSHLPLGIPLSRSLATLEIHQKVTDSSIASIFPEPMDAGTAGPELSSLILLRPDISNAALRNIASLRRLAKLHLPCQPKPSQSAIPDRHQQNRRSRVSANVPRLPPPAPTHGGLIPLLTSLSRTITDIDISGCVADPPPPQYASSTVNMESQTASHDLLRVLSTLPLKNLVIALSPSSGLTLTSLSDLTLPGLKDTLERLTILPRPNAVRIDESTVDEEEVLGMFSQTVKSMDCTQARASGWRMRSVVLQGLDFVGGGGGGSGGGGANGGGSGGLRFYYGVVGDPWRVDWVVGRFKEIWTGVEISVKCER